MPHGRNLRAGVIGAGGIGRVHVDCLRRINVDVVAVVASSPSRSEEVASDLGVSHGCADAEELVGREDIDVVHVCTPNGLHVEQVRLALQAGKHVVCEKPLAPTVSEAEALLDEARGAGVVHAVAYNYRHYAALQAMRAAVVDGRLGRVHLMRGCYLLDEILLIDDPGSWMLNPALRGESLSLADVGVHWWDLAEHVSGQKVEEVVCSRQAVREGDSLGEDSAAIMLRLDGGAVAVAAISGAAPGHSNTIELELIGTGASSWWQQEDPEKLWIGELDRPVERGMRQKEAVGVRAPGTLQMPAGHVAGYLDAFRDLVAAIYDGVAGAAEVVYPTFEDGVRGVRVLEALLRSSTDQRWVAIER